MKLDPSLLHIYRIVWEFVGWLCVGWGCKRWYKFLHLCHRPSQLPTVDQTLWQSTAVSARSTAFNNSIIYRYWYYSLRPNSRQRQFAQYPIGQLRIGDPVAQWVKRRPTDLVVPCSSPAQGEIFSTVNGVPLRTAFHYRSPVVLIFLRYSWKWRKSQSLYRHLQVMNLY